jgi:hypothetical protein
MLLVVLVLLRLPPRLSRIVLLEARSTIDMLCWFVYHCSHATSHFLFFTRQTSVGEVTRMDSIFYEASSFNRDISNWDGELYTDASVLASLAAVTVSYRPASCLRWKGSSTCDYGVSIIVHMSHLTSYFCYSSYFSEQGDKHVWNV